MIIDLGNWKGPDGRSWHARCAFDPENKNIGRFVHKAIKNKKKASCIHEGMVLVEVFENPPK